MTRTNGFPEIRIDVVTPMDFESLLRDIQECLRVGALRQLEPSSTDTSGVRVVDIPLAGPWPDYIEAEFKARDGNGYMLTVETFHGAGGMWTPIGSSRT
jgi:hypothetical protein